jgi:hypothetical protein
MVSPQVANPAISAETADPDGQATDFPRELVEGEGQSDRCRRSFKVDGLAWIEPQGRSGKFPI